LTERQIRLLWAPPPLDSGSALFLDVDGTLLEIASHPDRVQIPSGLPSLLENLTQQHGAALALVSGRSLDEIDRLFYPWRGAAAGLHGIERRRADPASRPPRARRIGTGHLGSRAPGRLCGVVPRRACPALAVADPVA